MENKRLLFSAGPLRPLLEAWLIGLVLLFLLALEAPSVSPFVINNGVLFLAGACAFWPALRIAFPQGSWTLRLAWGIGIGIVLGLVLAAGLTLPAVLFGWDHAWAKAQWAVPPTFTFFLLVFTPFGYLGARLALRVWLRWDSMRRRRMVWALTHAQLTVVLVVLVVAITVLILGSFASQVMPARLSAGLVPGVIEWLLRSIFPTVSVISVLTLSVLLFLLPPFALVSFLVARRVTGRLEKLAAAARAFRRGRYETRVEVTGQDEVAQLQTDFNAMAADLQHTMQELQQERDKVAALLQSQQQLVASVSHELRTPVATMRSYLETSLSHWDEQLPQELKHDLQIVEDETVRLQRLIDDLFVVARSAAGGLPMAIAPCDAAAIIRQRVEAIAALAWESRRVEVTADIAPDLPTVLTDEGRLAQVVANLLQNAVRHTLPGGIVVAGAAAEESMVCITVRDTGEGIAAEDLPHIWERFYQSATMRSSSSGGAGLGLALVRELTEAMGGTVGVESSVGQGSCFTVRLPRA